MSIERAVVPSFGPGVKFRFDSVRNVWVLLAPERMFLPDESAIEILKLVDGIRSFGRIVEDLATRFNAPIELVAADAAAMLEELAGKRVVQL